MDIRLPEEVGVRVKKEISVKRWIKRRRRDGSARCRSMLGLALVYGLSLTGLCRKLLEWDEEDGFGPMVQPEDNVNPNKNSRVVVLKHMFTLKELEEDAALLLDLKEDVREECSSLGEVTNVVLYDVSAAQLFSDRYCS